jgi:cytoskeletal protein RodZ
MTHTDSVASYGPLSTGSSRTWRRLPIVVTALMLAAVLLVPATAFAAEATSGYSQTAPTPKTTPTTATTTPTTPTPSTGTSPSKEEKTTPESTTPSKETSPSTSTTPTTSKASTLPFTGFDLRWLIGGGLLLVGAGFSLVLVERRRRSN